MKFYDFLNRTYSLWLCAHFSLLLHIIIDVKRFPFIAAFFSLSLSACYHQFILPFSLLLAQFRILLPLNNLYSSRHLFRETFV